MSIPQKAEQLYTPPLSELEAFARCIYPAMLAYFESEEGKQEYAAWEATQVMAEENDTSSSRTPPSPKTSARASPKK
jgi:hypothetical protein